MSAIAPARPARLVTPVLARGEARRLLLHPVTLAGFGMWLLVSSTLWWGDDPRPLDVFEAVGSQLSWMPGVLMILVGYLVATREHRAGTLDLLGALPARDPERVRALCLASLAPGLAALVLNVSLTFLLMQQEMFEQNPTVAQVLQGPLTVVGAVLLGVMVAVWAPVAFAPAITVVVIIAAHMVLGSDPVRSLFGPAVFWAAWGVTDGELWEGFIRGSQWWHQVYVLGLCGMAAAGAMIRVARTRGVIAGGVLAVAVTVVAAVLQLP